MNDTTYKALTMIIEAGGYIGGDAIGGTIGISRNAINKHVSKLKESGIVIESGKRGYKYTESDALSEYTLRYKLEKSGIDFKPIVKACDSTNNYAKALDIDKPFLVAAPYQTEGKGRLKRRFLSSEGGAYTTFAIRPRNLSVTGSLNVVLLCGLAVANTLRKFGIDARIKWPNDVLVGGRKICGILLESTLDSERISEMYLGIGINVNNDLSPISDIAVSMSELVGKEIERERVIVELAKQINCLLSEFEKDGFDSLRREYINASCTIGSYVKVNDGDVTLSGKAIGITDYGYLSIIDDDGKEREIVVGDILPEELTRGN